MTQGLSGGHFGGATFTFATPETADPQNASSTGNPLAGALMGVPDNGRFQSEVNAVRTVSPLGLYSGFLEGDAALNLERRIALGR